MQAIPDCLHVLPGSERGLSSACDPAATDRNRTIGGELSQWRSVDTLLHHNSDFAVERRTDHVQRSRGRLELESQAAPKISDTACLYLCLPARLSSLPPPPRVPPHPQPRIMGLSKKDARYGLLRHPSGTSKLTLCCLTEPASKAPRVSLPGPPFALAGSLHVYTPCREGRNEGRDHGRRRSQEGTRAARSVPI